MSTSKRPLPTATCQHCKFVLKTGKPVTYYCRRFPPTLISHSQGASFPNVYQDDWCGEFYRTMQGQHGHQHKDK